ncbi:MAG: hypothetical protein BYD32DRAFT_492109 [Podila humilis]|nr:MAG: hypothetical protein BYD32DRAFT_492109 [Podila humilis]
MITLELGQCQQDLFKARAAIAARDEEVLKLGKAKEHKESEITAITQELEQYKMDLTKAQASIEQRDEEVFKMKNDKEAKEVAVPGEKECDFMRITRGLAHYQEEVVKAQATISEKDKQVLKMGEVREHDLRVLVNMLAEQEQGIEDMQVQRDKDVQKIKTLENTCQTLREQLSAPRRKGSVSMQLRIIQAKRDQSRVELQQSKWELESYKRNTAPPARGIRLDDNEATAVRLQEAEKGSGVRVLQELKSSRRSQTFLHKRLHIANEQNNITLAKLQESQDENANLAEQLVKTNVTVAEVTSGIGMLQAAMDNLKKHRSKTKAALEEKDNKMRDLD